VSKILIIDDDLTTCNLIKIVFRQHQDIQVLDAHDSASGIELVRQQHPDIIIMDLLLPHPGLDGWQATTAIKNDPAISHIPVIALTAADTGFNDADKAFEAGCDGYVVKPFVPSEFRDYLLSFLNP
jgi:CheY-like chemotaxis protein